MLTRKQRQQTEDAQRLALKIAYITLMTAIIGLIAASIPIITLLIS